LFPDSVQFVGDANRKVQRVGIVCGAGGSLLAEARQASADVLLTGELRFHEQLAAEALGLTVVLAGHYATERPGIEMLAQRLEKAYPDLIVWPSRAERDPAHSL